jgi:chromosomal replication initiator protein
MSQLKSSQGLREVNSTTNAMTCSTLAATQWVFPQIAPDALPPQRFWHETPPTFETFVRCRANYRAINAASILLNDKSSTQIVVFLGVKGVGKTHLLRAIQIAAHKRKEFQRGALYLSARTERDLAKIANFSEPAEIILLDDFKLPDSSEAIAGFARFIKPLTNVAKRLVLAFQTSSLDKVKNLPFFATAQIVPMGLPDQETRNVIVRNLLKRNHITLKPNRLARLLAFPCEDLVQLTRAISVFAFLEELDPMIASDFASTFCKNDNAIGIIARTVFTSYGLDEFAYKRKDRHDPFVEPRAIAMALSYKLSGATQAEITREFGNNDHATVSKAVDTIRVRCTKDRDFLQKVLALEKTCRKAVSDFLPPQSTLPDAAPIRQLELPLAIPLEAALGHEI